MSPRAIWTGRILGALGFLLGVVVTFRYLITTTPSDLFLGLGLAAIVAVAAWVYLDWDLLAAVSGRQGTQRQAGSWAMVLLGAGIVVLINFLSYRHHWDTDITEGSIHSLSQQTTDLLDALEAEVRVTAFYKQVDASGEAYRHRERFMELVDRYGGRNKLFVAEIIDPDVEPRRAFERGVFQNGVVFLECGEREERIILPDENDLTNALIKVTRSRTKTVYFLVGHGEREIGDPDARGYAELCKRLEQTGFAVEELELYRTGLIPAGAAALVIGGPSTALMDAEIPLIRDFVERRGGGLMVLLEPEVVTGLEPLLAEWGFVLQQDMVLDLLGEAAGSDSSTIIADLGHHEITSELAAIVILSHARTVSAAEDRADVYELLLTGPAAWADFDLESLEATFDPEVDVPGPLPLAAVTDVARVPVDAGGDDDSADHSADGLAHDDAAPAAVIVFGDSDLAANGEIFQYGNADLVLNSVSYLTHEEDLITIRPREEANRPLALLGWQRALIGVIAVPGVTLLALLAGVVAWFARLAR